MKEGNKNLNKIEEEKRQKLRTLKVLGTFFLVVIICTYISRFATASIIPKVKCETFSNMSITHVISTDGEIKKNKEKPIYVHEGILIDSMEVNIGDKITKGDVLMTLNKKNLEKQYDEEKLQLQLLQKKRKSAYDKLEINLLDLQIKEQERSVNELEALVKAGGKVHAENEGQVTEIRAKIGEYTTDTAEMLITDISNGYILNTIVSAQDVKYITIDEKAEVMADTLKVSEQYNIKSITQNENNSEEYIVSINVPAQNYSMGMTVDVKFKYKSKNYNMCVPIEAIRRSGEQKYVLVVDTKNTILGEEMIAKKIIVTEQESNNVYAAIESAALSKDDKIIVTSNKNIEAGDRVRLSED